MKIILFVINVFVVAFAVSGANNEALMDRLQFLHSPRFTYMDSNNDGVLTLDEIAEKYRTYMKNRGRFCGLDFVCDENENGEVTRVENSECIVKFFNFTIFPMLDTDKNGVISGAERPKIAPLVQEYFYHLRAHEITWIMEYCDVNMDGEIDLIEMLHIDAQLTNLDLLRLKFNTTQ